MPVTINGDGSITGLSVGGLPNGTVDADTLASNCVTAAKLATKTFISYAIIADIKASNADGGDFDSGAWRTRDLNTEIADPDNIVSLSSNQFTLGAGSYLIEFSAPACRLGSHQTRLYNATTSSEVQIGTSHYAPPTSGHADQTSMGAGRVTITGSTSFEIQHRGAGNSNVGEDTFGFGVGSSGSHSWGSTMYCLVKIYKEA